jgi:hypothetical protein
MGGICIQLKLSLKFAQNRRKTRRSATRALRNQLCSREELPLAGRRNRGPRVAFAGAGIGLLCLLDLRMTRLPFYGISKVSPSRNLNTRK